MGNLIGIGGLRLKLFVVLLAFALAPMMAIGLLSMMEMNHAAENVQEKITSLSNTLNRSAFSAASNEADQVQIALAKAGRYDEFFKKIKLENEVVASYASDFRINQSCERPEGLWVAPYGLNETLLQKREETLSFLCAPAKVLQSMVKAEPSCTRGYIGTEDGVLITWPEIDDKLSRRAPFDHRGEMSYLAARSSKKTIWTDPYINDNGLPAIGCVTPIYHDGTFFGVAGMEITLDEIYDDMSYLGGRGYPFILNESGSVVMRPRAEPKGALRMLFTENGLYTSNSSEIRELLRTMLRGETGSAVIGLGKADGYVAYAPIRSLGWSIGMAYPAEEMSLPARFIDAGIRDTSNSIPQGLTSAAKNIRNYASAAFIAAGIIAVISGFFICRTIEKRIDDIAEIANMIGHGEFEISEKCPEKSGMMGGIFSRMGQNLKDYVAEREAISEDQRSHSKELAISAEIKKSLLPGHLAEPEGYQVSAFSIPSDEGRIGFCDVLDVGEEKIALAVAEVSKGGIAGALLALVSKALLRSASRYTGPIRVIADVNLQISEHAHGMNLVCFYAVLDPANHVIEYLNAGFNPAFILDAGGSVDTLGGGGIALGALDRVNLKSERIPIQPGDVLIMYSNGVIEATNGWRNQLGAERLITVVKDSRFLSASEIVGAVQKDVAPYLKDRSPQDDLTFLILKRL